MADSVLDVEGSASEVLDPLAFPWPLKLLLRVLARRRTRCWTLNRSLALSQRRTKASTAGIEGVRRVLKAVDVALRELDSLLRYGESSCLERQLAGRVHCTSEIGD